MTASPVRRLPDFVIIGAQKAGTTTLFRWLADEPEIYMPSQKEIHFFSRDDLWKCGFDWYRQCFAGAAPGQLVGEASTSYTMSDYGSVPAERMASAMPHARLICILRNPEERLRSHYRHQVVRRRENRSLAEAAGHSMSGYLTTSLYFERLSPWLERFPRQQICVVRFEDLIGAGSAAWKTSCATSAWPYGQSPSAHTTPVGIGPLTFDQSRDLRRAGSSVFATSFHAEPSR
jgi:hypothetical protein